MVKVSFKKLMGFILIAIMVFCGGLFVGTHSNAEQSNSICFDDVVSYESVLVHKGDTLWSIAKSNLDHPSDAEVAAYVQEIVSLNQIEDNCIHMGNYILVPQYAS